MIRFLKRKIRMPESAIRQNLSGTVYVSFVISHNGKVTDVKVIKGISTDCDKEAIRIISMMPDWIAGKQNKVSVPVRMVLPIRFQAVSQN